jgi:hypothetical protein
LQNAAADFVSGLRHVRIPFLWVAAPPSGPYGSERPQPRPGSVSVVQAKGRRLPLAESGLGSLNGTAAEAVSREEGQAGRRMPESRNPTHFDNCE